MQITRVAVLTGVTLIATCITPYGWSGYGVFWANVTSAANAYFPDYQSPRFRSPQDYVLLLLSMAAFLALGIRRSRDLFQISLLVLCTVAAFHAQRDGWLLALAAVAVIANPVAEEVPSGERRDTSGESRATFLLATAVSLVLLLAVLAVRMPTHDAVLAKIAETLSGGCGRLHPCQSSAHAAVQPIFLGRVSHLVFARVSGGDRRRALSSMVPASTFNTPRP